VFGVRDEDMCQILFVSICRSGHVMNNGSVLILISKIKLYISALGLFRINSEQ
jgi:hypothetical protein